MGDLVWTWGQWRNQHTAVTSALAHPDGDIIKQARFCPKFEPEYFRQQRQACSFGAASSICVHRILDLHLVEVPRVLCEVKWLLSVKRRLDRD